MQWTKWLVLYVKLCFHWNYTFNKYILHLIHLRFIVYLPIWSMNSLYPWSCNSCSLYIKCMSIDDLNIIPAPFTLLVGRAWRLRYWRGTAHCTRRWYLPTPLPSPPIPTPSRWSRCSPVDGCSFSYWGLWARSSFSDWLQEGSDAAITLLTWCLEWSWRY